MGYTIDFPSGDFSLKPVNIGLLGFGTVGQGVANILVRNAAEIERRAGRGMQIKLASVRSQGKNLSKTLGIETTDNPALIVNRKHGVIVAFEPAVAGGIPIIKAIREGLAANRIDWLAGIINGTGNFILSEMASKGRDFADVLAQAQELGYAEADPEFDVEGIDAAHKLTILASIAFGIPLQFDAVFTEGISNISPEDVAYANELGYRIKHLGVAKRRADGIELRVHPTLIPQERLIANVNGVMNAVLVHSDAVGPTLYYGPGAGSEPTGSSVVADIVDVVRALTTDAEQRVPHLAFQFDALSNQPVLAPKDYESAYYLRLEAADQPGVMADIMSIFGKLDISIEAILQKEPSEQHVSSTTTVPVILLTRTGREGLIVDAINQISALNSVTEQITMIRVESLG